MRLIYSSIEDMTASCGFLLPVRANIFASNFNNFNDNRLEKLESHAPYRCGGRTLNFGKRYAMLFFSDIFFCQNHSGDSPW